MDAEIRQKILTLLDQHRIMTVATLRPDGWPQATTVGYVNQGLTLYFLCGLDSQKARNLARDDRISLTIDHDTADLMAITGLSMAARATAVSLFVAALFVGGAVGTALVAPLADRHAFDVIFLIPTALAVPLTVVAAVARSRYARRP